jgi:hypothetical protein
MLWVGIRVGKQAYPPYNIVGVLHYLPANSFK